MTIITKNYTHNPLGNLLTKTGQGSYVYAGDQGASYANPHAATTINGSTQAYDNNGNLTDDSVWDYTWDYRNRLIEATDGTTTVSYGYDNSDNRIWAFDGTATTTYPTRYYNITSAGTATKHIFGNNDMVATVEDDGQAETTHYLHTDHLGGSSVITDENGQLEETIDYYPFGEIRLDEKEGIFDEQRKFTGHEYDEDTGLSYMVARYQDGEVGRFMSEDPAFLNIGNVKDNKQLTSILVNPQKLNSYSYTENNPLKNVDPTGQSSVSAWMSNPITTAVQTLFWLAGSKALEGSNHLGGPRPASSALMQHSLTINPNAVSITENNQGKYGNIVDQIKGSSEFNSYINNNITTSDNGDMSIPRNTELIFGKLFGKVFNKI